MLLFHLFTDFLSRISICSSYHKIINDLLLYLFIYSFPIKFICKRTKISACHNLHLHNLKSFDKLFYFQVLISIDNWVIADFLIRWHW